MDCFALLGVPRRPWIDPDRLKERFHELSARHHPDVRATGSGEAFAELNAAYQILRDPVRRLRHLLELEGAGESVRTREIPPELIDLFMETGRLRADFNHLAAKHSEAASALAQALLASKKSALKASLHGLLSRLDRAQSAIVASLEAMDSYSEGKISEAHQRLAFLSKWSRDLSEANQRIDSW